MRFFAKKYKIVGSSLFPGFCRSRQAPKNEINNQSLGLLLPFLLFSWMVRLGDTNLGDSSDDGAVIERQIRDIHVDPDFRPTVAYFDVAVIEIDEVGTKHSKISIIFIHRYNF
jgi:hypothetical protein